MKVSVITVTYNSGSLLENAIKSVAAQNYKNIEYIVIDGNSKDGTIDIVKRYYKKGIVNKFVSEPDEGIYDAMNKGLKMASGDIIAFLNSDDFYFSENVINDVVEQFISHNSDVCYGDVFYVARNNINKIIRYWRSGNISISKLMYGWQIPHPSLFVSKELAMKVEGFNSAYKIAADFEYMLKVVSKANKVIYLNKPLVVMRWGGTSTANLSNMIRGNREIYTVLKKYDLINLPFLIFLLLRFSTRCFQILEGLKWRLKKPLLQA